MPLRRSIKRFFASTALLRYLGVPSETRRLHDAMWAGFGAVAVRKLVKLTTDRPKAEIADAAWALALWYRSAGDHRCALKYLAMQHSVTPRVRYDPFHLAILIEVLIGLGKHREAERAVHEAAEEIGEIAEICFCAANVAAVNPQLSPSERNCLRLNWLNKPLVSAGLAPLVLKNPTEPMTLDNVAVCLAENRPRVEPWKISVLMSAYNAEDTIAYAIGSVLGQTWSNLELIIIDDGSDDGTWKVIKSFAMRDPRVRPVRHGQNRGAYAARNAALVQASGDFITVHDTDDWSHPEKLSVQALALLDGDEVANATKQIRVHSDMRVYVKPDGSTILDCYPSLMMPKTVLAELGAWDDCRMGADDELWKRLLTRHKRNKMVVKEAVPLSLHLYRDDSLTAQPDIGASSLYYGARRQYREAYRYWHHLEMGKAKPDFMMRPGERRFPMPQICKAGPQRGLEYHVLFVSDFSGLAGNSADDVNLICAAHEFGLRSACFHWPRLEFAGRDVALEIRKLLHYGLAESVVAGEDVSCRLAVISDPAILDHVPDILPKFEAMAALVIASADAALTSDRQRHFTSVFGLSAQQATTAQAKDVLSGLRRLPALGMLNAAIDQVPSSPGASALRRAR